MNCTEVMLCTGVELLQPSSAAAGAALFALLYSALSRVWSSRRPTMRQILDAEEEGSPSVAAAREAALQRRVAGRVRAVADAVAPVIASVAALAVRRLSGVCLVGPRPVYHQLVEDCSWNRSFSPFLTHCSPRACAQIRYCMTILAVCMAILGSKVGLCHGLKRPLVVRY